MGAPVIGVYLLGQIALRVASKKVAEMLVKRGARKLSEKAAKNLKTTPKKVTEQNFSSVVKAKPPAQPRSPGTGRMQTNSNPPAAAKTTAPKIVRNKPTQPAAPKRVDNTPAVRTSTNKPTVGSKAPNRGSSGASYSRVKPNQPKAKNDSKIVGISPLGKAVLAAPALAGSLPEVDTVSRPTKKAPARTAPYSMKMPKKDVVKKEVVKKKTTPAPKGPMTLTKYLNDEIKKRGSSVTAEKKGSDKYTSISAAKKAGSLYYKNTKTGKTMAAVYKEDLTK
jgi:hypothetical protein